jgi:hypothetical protein
MRSLPSLLRRATAVWLGILVLASLNGAVRDLLLMPHLGDTVARAISTVVLCALILLVTWRTIGWLRPGGGREAWLIGAWWLGLTLAFEFLAGHFLFRKPWAALLADYDLRQGRIWVAVLVTTLLAPWWVARRRASSVDSAGRGGVARTRPGSPFL